MTQEIKPAYATYEQAKWLKEKGFLDKNIYGEIRLSQSNFYDPNGILHHIRDAFGEKSFDLKDCYNAPEQWQVVEWLRVNHGIIVFPLPDNEDDFIKTQTVIYTPVVYRATKGLHNLFKELIRDEEGKPIKYFGTPQEAYSAAFDYIKNKNLI
jgi:hypothetical protein